MMGSTNTGLRKAIATAAALATTLLLGGAGKPLPTAPRAQNWNNTVTATDHDSYVLGNPAAPVKLVEFISYTCPHCAHFEGEADAPLRLGFVATGKGSVEVRNFLRDPIDMTVALLTHCGPPSKFFLNHAAFLRSQDKWIAPYQNPSPMQKQRWSAGDFKTRTRNIATDFHFYEIMRTRGYDRPAVDTCLANEALAKRLAQHTDDAVEKLNVNGTPGFMLDGVVLAATYTWDELRPQLEARAR